MLWGACYSVGPLTNVLSYQKEIRPTIYSAPKALPRMLSACQTQCTFQDTAQCVLVALSSVDVWELLWFFNSLLLDSEDQLNLWHPQIQHTGETKGCGPRKSSPFPSHMFSAILPAAGLSPRKV